ncbi:14614_t:CDS:2 [Acaulospora morrowiae]|uniref:14614_t:CDS:1 n=1 Tax=Acaulospora morrowiae TaxID=94023 RepID=A0A9N9ER06_9GLOM|nr:14614_t:CDS:2 [Acaulospora morrowiae]
MDPIARNIVNLNVLRRHDEKIVEIIDSSSHVVVYKIDHEQSAWTKKGVEGTMFVFKRQPVYGFIVMNRLGIDNFMAPLTDSMELEFKDEIIIYRTDDDDIHGIWVFEEKDKERIGKTLRECRESAKTVEVPPPLEHLTPKSYGKQINIEDLLKSPEINQTNGSTISTPQRSTSSHELPQKTSHDTPNNILDGKMLLKLLRQPTNVSKATSSNPNSYISPKPIPQLPLPLPTETIPYDQSLGPPFSNNQGGSNANISALFGINSPELQRTQVLDASITCLPRFPDGTKKMLSKSEFTQKYLNLIQSDPSFMDILYQNYIVKTQENM